MSLRRPITPRATMSRIFRDLERGYASMWGDKLPATERDRYEMMTHRLREAADYAISTVQEAPPFDQTKLGDLIEGQDPERAIRFVRGHLERELAIINVSGLDPVRTTDELLAGLRGQGDLSQIATEVVGRVSGLEAPHFTAYQVETILREAVGLDGRVPEREFNEDVAAYNLMCLRFLLEDAEPGQAPEPQEKTASEAVYDRDRVEEVLTASGLPALGISRDMSFHVAVGNIAEDAIRRIGALMGDEVSPEHTAMLYGLLERVAHATGPQLVMSLGDEGPDGP